jgi:DUF2075 family protein
MSIYQNLTLQFVEDIRNNRLTDIMTRRFYQDTGRLPGKREASSWQNSLPRVSHLIEIASLNDNMILLEYGVPYNQCRIDCLLFGKGQDGNDNVVLLELKGWTEVIPLKEEGNFEEVYKVKTATGGTIRPVPHPSQQVKGYQHYLKSFITAFETPPPLSLFSCSYCHNYSKNANAGLFNPIYQTIIDEFPVYTREDTEELAGKLKVLLGAGNGTEVLHRFLQSPVSPSKKLLDNVTRIIKNEAVFHLLNEQLVAKNLIWSRTRQGLKNNEKSIVIVHGGPGTGKSLIAINILAEAAKRKFTVFYGCKSKSFTNGLKKLVGPEGRPLFSNLYRFLPSRMKENELNLLLVDEAHRIERSSDFKHTKPADKTDMPQIDQLIRVAKTIVFFIDDRQIVRSQEVGSSLLIRQAAEKLNIPVWETTLENQFRCMGSNDYLLWLESVLGYPAEPRNPAEPLNLSEPLNPVEPLKFKKSEKFEFRIFDSPQQLYEKLKTYEAQKPNSARLVAGFCWRWSDPAANGELVKDVVIEDFAMPWEAKEGFNLAPGIPQWFEWAYHSGGFNQIGCIYTCQGFEFDYIGVIIGKDLQYDPKKQALKTDITKTCDPTLKKDPGSFDSHVRNIYRVLMTRGMKGCYVYFEDKATENYFRSRIEE